ncbi:YigZ family protein [Sporolactobacillus shoreicorticis]|uniref:YigZ family protein n=1 Tax=Sporolactobacillus shoreicorticis TaxID=1923877 RepID=A0ABW5RY44_9BACL|nr:YigZ family protein [Sporolactobacillus shoreicorticis]MCO7124984.1 YigZ family protein [Sporolactobacillus shoreicorticis]
MPLIAYVTVGKGVLIETEIKRSRFICSVHPVETETDAEQFIQNMRKEHWKANHNCFAYIIGKKQEIQKASDDGEPSGTAGVPILDVLKRRGVCNVLVVVTRYFGGIKLGTGGLIRAYAHAASAGLNAAEVVKKVPSEQWTVTVDYHLSGTLENKLRESAYIIKKIHYSDKVSFDLYASQEDGQAFLNWVTDLTNGQAETKKSHELYLEEKLPNPSNTSNND